MTDANASKLLSFRLQGWRCIEDVRIDLADRGATWLVGANGTGKSSLLDGLAFISDVLHHGQAALDATLRGEVGAGSQRLFLEELVREVSEPARWEIRFTIEGRVYTYIVALRARGSGFVVEDERLLLEADGTDTELLENDGVTARWRVGGSADGDGFLEPAFEQRKVLLLSHAVDEAKLPAVAPVLRFVRGIWLFRLDPLLMRGARKRPAKGAPLDRYGRDLAAYLAAAQDDPQLMSALAEAAEVLGWERMSFRVDDDGQHLQFVERSGRALELRAASDGQSVQAMLVLLCLYPPPDASVMLFDEPAVAVDVRQAEALGSYLEHLSSARSVLAATQVVDALESGERRNVRFLLREDDGRTKVRALEEVVGRDPVFGLYRPSTLTREALLLYDSAGVIEDESDG